MGIKISNEKYGLVISHKGFVRIKKVVSQYMGEEFAMIYDELYKDPYREWARRGFENRHDYYVDYYKRVNTLCEENDINRGVVGFLYNQTDNMKIDSVTCNKILSLIRDHNDEEEYGYDNAEVSFEDFKRIVQGSTDGYMTVCVE